MTEYINEKVKNAFLNFIKKIAFEEEGIFYGAMVRDEYISEHYKKLYNKHIKKIKKNPKYNKNLFWDTSYHPESAYRTLLTDNISLTFPNPLKAQNFIDKIFKNTDINDFKLNTYLAPPYMPQIKYIKKLNLNIVIGNIPFIFKGEILPITIDIIEPVVQNLSPPFYNLDLLCNGFIMTKDGKKLSNKTGTIIDKYTEFERTIVSGKIIKDILEFKTYICLNPSFYNNMYYLSFNNHCINIIKEMYSKKYPWTIINMPFESNNLCKTNDSNCCICFNSIEINEKTCNTYYIHNKVKCKAPSIHYDCMMKYLFSQLNDVSRLYFFYQTTDVDDYIRNNQHVSIFKCPYRNTIDFTNCRKVIKDIYKDV